MDTKLTDDQIQSLFLETLTYMHNQALSCAKEIEPAAGSTAASSSIVMSACIKVATTIACAIWHKAYEDEGATQDIALALANKLDHRFAEMIQEAISTPPSATSSQTGTDEEESE